MNINYLNSPKENLKSKFSSQAQSQNTDNFITRINQIRKILFMLFEEPSSSTLALLISILIMIAIASSFAIIVADSLNEDNQSYREITEIMEFSIFIVFLIEYLIRFSCCTVYGQTIYKFITSPMNIIDVLSLLPAIIDIIFYSSKIKGFQVIRVIKFFRIFRVIKIRRYLKGIEILTKGVTRSFKQFYFLLAAFILTNFVFAVPIYYSEITQFESDNLDFHNDYDYSSVHSFLDAFWLSITTVTTVGYGDKTPKTFLGRTFTAFLSFLGNTIILALPIAIIGLDFQKVYENDQEQKKVYELKEQIIDTQLTMKQKECQFMSQRIKMIEKKNQEMKILIEKSTKMAKEITSLLKKIYSKMDEDQIGINMNEYNFQMRKRHKGSVNILTTKANMFEKMMRAKKKIQITNIFKNVHLKGRNNSDQDNNSNYEKSSISRTKNNQESSLIPLTIQFNQIDQNKSNKSNIQKKKKKTPFFLKSNSFENENELIKLRNEEFGMLPYDFMNDILVQMQDELVEGLKIQDVYRKTLQQRLSIISSDQQQHRFSKDFSENISFLQFGQDSMHSPGLKFRDLSPNSRIYRNSQQESLFLKPIQIQNFKDVSSDAEFEQFNLEKNEKNDVKKDSLQNIGDKSISPSHSDQRRSMFLKSSTNDLKKNSLIQSLFVEQQKKSLPQQVKQFETKSMNLTQINQLTRKLIEYEKRDSIQLQAKNPNSIIIE